MPEEWKNWSGSLRFTPGKLLFPKTEEEMSEAVKNAVREGRKVRVVGAGHSSSPLVETDDVLVSVDKLQGVISHDNEACEATIFAGMKIHKAGEELQKVQLAMPNTGDVDVQNLSGAIGTGTHGSGQKLQNLSAMLLGARLVTPSGEIIEKHVEDGLDVIRALRLSMGTLGIFTRLRLKLQPAYRLHRREWCTHIDDCLEHLDELIETNRNFDFYWYPRSDMAKIRILNPPGEGMQDLPYAKCVEEKEGWSGEVLARERELKFDEMEYALPAEAGRACFDEVRKRVKEKHRKYVGWRVLYRTIARDDTFLSPYYNRESVTISLHHNAGLPYWDYFRDIEPIFRDHGGRPHWAKKHTLEAEELKLLYPEWDKFMEIRKTMDPDGVFLTPYMQRLLGVNSV